MAKKTSSSRRRSRPVTKKKNQIDKNVLILAGIAIVIIIAIAGYILLSGGNGNENTNNNTQGNPIAVIDTSKGIIKIELYEDEMPKTCANFIKLVNDGFYDGMIFHRVMDDFMIQAGSTNPDGSMKESPYGTIEFESSDLSHEDGSISMASTGWAVGGSAQFFICDGAQSSLDGGYATFGKTIEGIDVVRDIADEDNDGSLEPSPGGGKPLEDILINSITIES
jgi:peptidyl-prolyl cis-trans isomerase A (cyclophilin A)